RPGMVPAPMPETGGRECGSPAPGRYSAQSQRPRVTEAGPPPVDPRTHDPRPVPGRARLNCPGTASVAVRREPLPGARTGVAVTARGRGGRTPAGQGRLSRAGHLVAFRLDRVTWPGETQYNRVEHNFGVSRMENRLAADQRPRVLVTGGSGFIGRRAGPALLGCGARAAAAGRGEPPAPGAPVVGGGPRGPPAAAPAAAAPAGAPSLPA